MALVDIGRVGAGGIVTDIAPCDLPLHVWSDGINIEFDRDGVRPMAQEKEVLGAFQVNPLGLFPILLSTNNQAWIYAGETKIYSIVDLVHTDITRTVGGAYSASQIVKWNGGVLNGVPILNNSFDVPQQIDPNNLATPVTDLANWPGTLRATVVRPFGNFLIAIGASDTGISFPSRTLVWSDPADPGSVPPSWDWANPATRAGVKTFSESPGLLVDGKVLRDELILYKTDAIWSMRFIGGTLVFAFKKLFDDVGLINANAVVPFDKYHLFVSKRDIYLHDGITLKSVADGKVRDRIFGEMNAGQLDNVFCQHEVGKNRIWVFYPTTDQTWADRAAIWDYREDTWTFRETPQVSAAANGYFDLDLGDTWDSQGGSWDSLDVADYWDGAIYSATTSNIVMTSFVEAATFDAGTGLSTDGVVTWTGNSLYPPAWFVENSGDRMVCRVERRGLAVAGKDHLGQPTVNRTLQKVVTEVWPELSIGPCRIRIGTQDTPLQNPVWSEYSDFDPLVDLKADFLESTKFIAVEFSSSVAVEDWRLSGYSLNIEKGGIY